MQANTSTTPNLKQLQTSFVDYVKTKKFDSAEKLLSQYREEIVNAKDVNGRTALYYSAFFGNSDFIKILIDAGADPTLKVESLYPLDAALNNKKYEAASLLIARSDKIDITSLARAIYHNNIDSTTLLLNCIKKIDISTQQYYKLLGYPKSFIINPYVLKDDLKPISGEIAVKLIEKVFLNAIPLSLETKYLKATLDNAIKIQDMPTIKALLKYGKNAVLYEDNNKLSSTALEFMNFVTQKGDLEMALYLRQHCHDKENSYLLEHITNKIKASDLFAADISLIISDFKISDYSPLTLKDLTIIKICKSIDILPHEIELGGDMHISDQ